jgi:hypothetical protein
LASTSNSEMAGIKLIFMPDYKFVDNTTELASSTLEFFYTPWLWRQTVGNAPKYFVHMKINGRHLFGLSEFCAFKKITVQRYIQTHRYKIDGGTTRHHIAWLTNSTWTKHVAPDIRAAFEKWISSFFPNYQPRKALFITISVHQLAKGQPISEAELEKRLEIQRQIGRVGELLAVRFETSRLSGMGYPRPKQFIQHISKRHSGAGYDILSSTPTERRYIEVKSSLRGLSAFYITENEVQTLRRLVEEAYLYLVKITNLKRKLGKVYHVVRNPIEQLDRLSLLTAVAFKVDAQFLVENLNLQKRAVTIDR